MRRTQANSAEDTEERVGAPHKNCVEYHFEESKVRGRRITSVLVCVTTSRLVQRISNEGAKGATQQSHVSGPTEKQKFSAAESLVRRTCSAVPRVGRCRRGFGNHAPQFSAHRFAIWCRSAGVLHSQCHAIVMRASRPLYSLLLLAILRACRNQAHLTYGH